MDIGYILLVIFSSCILMGLTSLVTYTVLCESEKNRTASMKLTKYRKFMFSPKHLISAEEKKVKSMLPADTILDIPQGAKFKVRIGEEKFMHIQIVNGVGSQGFIPHRNSTFQKSMNNAPEKIPKNCSVAFYPLENESCDQNGSRSCEEDQLVTLLPGTRYCILGLEKHYTLTKHELNTQMVAVLIS